jgi:two-component system sensor histidine kinase KdpD
VLVDELAHTNAPGSRHAKRYQDVLELLESGMSVWTTVNVQHFESRADAVQQITGIPVRETVPDTLLEIADEIELIDLSPEELRKRLAEGKVYTAERTDTAANNFFRTGNLTALREMALRLTAEHVDHQLQNYMQIKRIAGPWRTNERLMVAVGTGPLSEHLIRATRRLAYNLEAPWLAVHVVQAHPPSAAEQEALSRHFDLAVSLGAEVVTTNSEIVADGLLYVAHQRNVSQIVVGKPRARGWQTWLAGPSLIEQLSRAGEEIDIHVVSGGADAAGRTKRAMGVLPIDSAWKAYGIALLVVAAMTLVNLLLETWLTYLGAGLTFLLAVLLVAVYLGRGPALLAAVMSAFTWDFLFIEPELTFHISRPQDVILFLLYFVIAIFTGNLTARLRTQEKEARANADRADALYTLAHETVTSLTMDEVIQTAINQIGHVFRAQAAVLLASGETLVRTPHEASTLVVDDRDFGAAVWVFKNVRPAGRSTETLPLVATYFLPLRTASRTVGVLGVRPQDDRPLPFDQRLLIETFAGQIALGIERELLDETAAQAALLQESERLYTTLLNSISHELRTPIAAINGAASSLQVPETWEDEDARVALIGDIRESALRLNRLVENLLDMSRLESGRVALKRDWCDVGDIITAAIRHAGDCLLSHRLKIDIARDLPLLRLDFVLVEQVLVNLLLNLCHYTPPDAPARVSALVRGGGTAVSPNGWVEIEVADGGQGIPEEEWGRVFEKFYRVPGSVMGGTGLGLAISKASIEAHGGSLEIGHAPEGGALFTIRLPIRDMAPSVQEASA